MPAPPINQTLSLTGADAVKAQLADVSSSGSASLAALAESAVGLTGSFGGLQTVLEAAAPALAALFGAASLGGLYDLASSAAEATHQLENLAQVAGTSSESMQGFEYALASVGVSSDTGEVAMTKMLAVLGKADEAFSIAAAAAGDLANAQQIAAEKSDLSVRSAETSANSAYNAAIQSADAITKAQIGADKAALSYEALRTKLAGATGTAQQMRDNSIRLTDAQATLQNATDGITAAQTRSAQASAAAALAQDRAKIADDERSAAIDKLTNATTKGITPFQDWLKEIGVAGADMKDAGIDGTEAFYKVLDGLQKLGDTEQALYAKDIWGRGWKEMIPAITAGGTALRNASEEWQSFGYDVTDSDKKMASAFLTANREFGQFIGAIKLQVGDRLAALFTPLFTTLDNFFKDNGNSIEVFMNGFVAAVGDASKAISVFFGAIWTVAGPILKEYYTQLEDITDIFNKTFGTNLTAAEVLFDGVFLLMGSSVLKFIGSMTGLTKVFGDVVGGIRGVVSASVFLITSGTEASIAWSPFIITAGAIAGIIALLIYNFVNWDSQVKGWTDAWGGFWILLKAVAGWLAGEFIGIVDSVTQAFSDAWNTAISFVEGLWNGLVNWIKGVADQILAFFKPVLELLEKVGKALGIVSSAGAAAAGSAAGSVGLASGGTVPGSGSGDTVPIMATPGEFVVSKPAVDRIGVGALHALNSGYASLMALGGVVRAGLGSLGSSMQPQRFATGGMVAAAGGSGGGHTLNLTIDGHSFAGLTMPEHVGKKMESYARSRAIQSAGVKPSWYKG